MKSYKKIFIFSLLLAASLFTGKLSYAMRPDGGCEVLSDGLLDPYCEGPGGSGGGGPGGGGGDWPEYRAKNRLIIDDCNQDYDDDDIWPGNWPQSHTVHFPKVLCR